MHRRLAQFEIDSENGPIRCAPLKNVVPAPITTHYKGFPFVHAATKDRYLLQFYKGNPFTMQIVHAYFECRDHIF